MVYKEKSHTFSLRPSLALLLFCKEIIEQREIIGQRKISARLPAMEEGYLHKDNLIIAYLSLGGVNVYIL